MKAKIKSTQQVIEVRLTDATGEMPTWTYESIDGTERFLGHEITFEDLTDYKTWTESLIHDLAIEAYRLDYAEKAKVAADVVSFAFAICDRMMQENKTWRR